MKFQDICLHETDKIAILARIVSSSIQWHRMLHESIHVLRET